MGRPSRNAGFGSACHGKVLDRPQAQRAGTAFDRSEMRADAIKLRSRHLR
jgi:hypothetical protein